MNGKFEQDYFESKSSYGEQGGYDRLLGTARAFYDEYFRIAVRAQPQIAAGSGKTALEIGCAFGVGAAMLHERGYRVLATDVSEYACRRAASLVPAGVEVRRVDLLGEAGSLGSFDLVLCIQVVEHVADPRFLREVCARVAPGGVLIVATPNPKSVSPYRRFQHDPTHVNERNAGEWRKDIEQSGLEVVSSQTYHIVPVIHRWIGTRYLRVPESIGYDTVIVARRAC